MPPKVINQLMSDTVRTNKNSCSCTTRTSYTHSDTTSSWHCQYTDATYI